LDHLIPNLLNKTRGSLLFDEAESLLVEIIVPLSLWHWNLSRIPTVAGPLKVPLGEMYALVLRSWDRIYNPNYDGIRFQWGVKWNVCRCNDHAFELSQFYSKQQIITSDFEILYNQSSDPTV
jgi:hypothetical protein